jgi:hypothetical protein
MELEDLKNMWKEQNSRLEKSITLSEQLLKNAFTQKANGVLDTWLRWEYFSLIVFIVSLIFISIATYKFMDDWRFLLSGIFGIGFLAFCIINEIISIKQLNTISLFSQSIVDTKQSILKYKKWVNQSMKILFFFIPLIFPAFLLLSERLIHNINLFDYPHFFTILSIGFIPLSYIIVFISYQIIYSRKFKIIENNLIELEKFKEE